MYSEVTWDRIRLNYAKNVEFLQNRAENQNYEKGYAEIFSAGGSMFDENTKNVSYELEVEFTPNLTVFDHIS